jgi:hypothetical protein
MMILPASQRMNHTLAKMGIARRVKAPHRWYYTEAAFHGRQAAPWGNDQEGRPSLRRLLISGANSIIIKRHVHSTARPGTWLGGMLTRKPPMLVRVALANKMARIFFGPSETLLN